MNCLPGLSLRTLSCVLALVVPTGAWTGTATAGAAEPTAEPFRILAGDLDSGSRADGACLHVVPSAGASLSTASQGDSRVDGPIWSAEGDQPGAYFGYTVATAGDVNGDGYSDVIVGAHSWDGAYVDEGAAFLYLGSAAGLSPTPSWSATSSQAGAGFANSVAPAGDVNGDGYGDVIVGCYLYDGGQTNEGRAYVYLGSESGLEATPVWTAEGNQADAQFSRSVATAGDVNGDGYDDILIGSQYYDGGMSNEGRAFLYLGSASGPMSTPAWSREGNQTGAQFGYSVATAGDVNADGYADVIIGANLYDNGLLNRGRAWVYLGTSTGLSFDAVWAHDGEGASDNFGHSVAPAGDINGDGYADILVGAPYADDPFAGWDDEGRAYLFLGSSTGPRTTAIWTGKGGQDSAYYGSSVATAGDVNGDLFADVVIGAWGWDGGQVDEGRAAVYLGSAVELFTTPVWTHEVDQAGARFGWSVAAAGDVDGDGCGDVLVGAWYYDDPETNEGGAWVFRGEATGLASNPGWLEVGDQSGAWLGAAVAGAGDVNADGFSDILCGAPFYTAAGEPRVGRAWEYLGYPAGPYEPANWIGYGEQFEADYGHRLASAGDVNGDGYDDILVSAYDHSLGEQTYEGKVWLHLGSENGLEEEAAWVRIGESEIARFGYALASAGDVNGDGYADVLVGSDYYTSDDVTFRGKVWLFHGSIEGLAAEPDWEREGAGVMVMFGAAVASAGDVNGDGYDDVLVGAPALVQTGVPGRAYLFLGSPGGLGSEPVWTGTLGQANDFYGVSVGSAGDVNGDGYADVIVGARGYDQPGFPANGGAVEVYLGSAAGLSATPSWFSWADQMDAGMGSVVGTAGDVNGDGFSDCFFTAPDLNTDYPDQGGVWVKLGSASGLSGYPEWFETAGTEDCHFGISAGCAGDVNADGFDDLIVGGIYSPSPLVHSGLVTVYFGNGKNLSYRGRALIARHTQPDGGPLAWRGMSTDETSFGLAATLTGAGGRARLRLEWQTAELGDPIGPAPVEHGDWELSWGVLPDAGSVVPVTELVTGGVEGTPRIWRCRAAARSPFFPHGPWMSMPGTVPTQQQLRLAGGSAGVPADPMTGGSAAIIRIDSVRPNPFSPRTTLVYSLTAPALVRLSVHDATGREVAVLLEGWKEAGRHVARWSGQNKGDGALPSGVYFARLSVGDVDRTAKLILAR